MTFTYTPPAKLGSFVAYAASAKRLGNAETGEATDFRRSVFVREYASVRVASFERKSGTFYGETFHFGTVKFDAASVGAEGLRNDFGAQVEAGSVAAQFLERAHQEQLPVMVVLETVARPKRKNNAEPIPHTAYIHDLRGAERDGKGGNANQTGDACQNIVVGVAPAGRPELFALTGEVESDPTEWESLRNNRDHTLPPTGWRTYEGGIIPTSNGGGGSDVDVDDLAARVADRLKPIMENRGRPRPTQRSAHSQEAKEWEPWNSDGRLNLGGYLLGKERAVFAEAYRLLTNVRPSAALDDVWPIVAVLHWISDSIQSAAYGPGARPSRTAKSNFEAAKWAEYTYTTLAEHNPDFAFTAEVASDVAAQQEWAQAVVETATALYRRAAGNVEAHLTGETGETGAPTDAPAPAASPSTGGEAQTSHTPGSGPTSGGNTAPAASDSEPVVVQRYEALLASAGQSAYPERFHPLLTQQFGAWQIGRIEPSALSTKIDEWEADIDAFLKSARAAWDAAKA